MIITGSYYFVCTMLLLFKKTEKRQFYGELRTPEMKNRSLALYAFKVKHLRIHCLERKHCMETGIWEYRPSAKI